MTKRHTFSPLWSLTKSAQVHFRLRNRASVCHSKARDVLQEASEPQPPNPAEGRPAESSQGLGKLDAEAEEDKTPVESKIEEVAKAMGLEQQAEVSSSSEP